MMPLQIIHQISVENMLLRMFISIIFEKENGGLSSARNFGIECSTGAYLTFVDSDDWIDSSCLETLYKLMIKHSADVSIACYSTHDEERACLWR